MQDPATGPNPPVGRDHYDDHDKDVHARMKRMGDNRNHLAGKRGRDGLPASAVLVSFAFVVIAFAMGALLVLWGG